MTRSDPQSAANSRTLLVVLMLVVLGWGLLIALGVLIHGNRPVQSLYVVGATLGFLGLWGLMLWIRGRSNRRPANELQQPAEGESESESGS